MLLRLSRRLVQSSYKGSRAISRLRSGIARVELRASVFCTVREKVPHPLCGFYAAAFTRLLALLTSARAPRSSVPGDRRVHVPPECVARQRSAR